MTAARKPGTQTLFPDSLALSGVRGHGVSRDTIPICRYGSQIGLCPPVAGMAAANRRRRTNRHAPASEDARRRGGYSGHWNAAPNNIDLRRSCARRVRALRCRGTRGRGQPAGGDGREAGAGSGCPSGGFLRWIPGTQYATRVRLSIVSPELPARWGKRTVRSRPRRIPCLPGSDRLGQTSALRASPRGRPPFATARRRAGCRRSAAGQSKQARCADSDTRTRALGRRCRARSSQRETGYTSPNS